jgi:hypothetical protein
VATIPKVGKVWAKQKEIAPPVECPSSTILEQEFFRSWYPSATEANQSCHRARGISLTSVACPNNRTPKTVLPLLARYSPSILISCGAAVKPCVSKQPTSSPGKKKGSPPGRICLTLHISFMLTDHFFEDVYSLEEARRDFYSRLCWRKKSFLLDTQWINSAVAWKTVSRSASLVTLCPLFSNHKSTLSFEPNFS